MDTSNLDYEAQAQSQLNDLKSHLLQLKIRLDQLPSSDNDITRLSATITSSELGLCDVEEQLKKIREQGTAAKIIGLWVGTNLAQMCLLYSAVKAYSDQIGEVERQIWVKEFDSRNREGNGVEGLLDPPPPYRKEVLVEQTQDLVSEESTMDGSGIDDASLITISELGEVSATSEVESGQ